MAGGTISLTTLGAWDKQVGVGLASALAVSMDVFGLTGESACRQCVWFMTQSASKLAGVAPEKRPVEANPDFRHLLKKGQYKAMRMAGTSRDDIARKYMRYRAPRYRQPPKEHGFRYANSKERIERIGRRGLAQNSWLWAHGTSKQFIPGVTDLYTVSGARNTRGIMASDMTAGYVLRNRLSYINEAMPPMWEATVERNATNRIMGMYKSKLEREWRARMGMPLKPVKGDYQPSNAELSQYFLAYRGGA